MCGIFGVYARQPFPEKSHLARQAVEKMRHRGPDEQGFFADDLVSLASCRLSIVDVIGGQQPHTNREGDLVLICNGEIYNHLELRHTLKQKGHCFKTGSDTEVILHLYEEKGADLLEDLAGMFSFALWDRQRETLLLARDRVGIKPLYIYSDDQVMAFSSEMSSLIEVLNLPPSCCRKRFGSFCPTVFLWTIGRQSISRSVVFSRVKGA